MRNATIRDVARSAGVSVATVSRVLNQREPVSAGARERVHAAVAELDYVPHSGARSLSTRRTDTIGVILPDLHGEFFSELIRGIDLATRAHRLHLLLSHSHGDPHEATAVLRAMRSRVDAMVVMSPYADEGVLSAALGGRTPVVLLGSGSGVGSHTRFEIDNHAGAFAMTNGLIEAGYRRIAFIAGPLDNIEAERRLAGYRDALDARGGPVEQIVQGDFSETSGHRAARLLLDSRPDAIFAGNDMMAIGCLQALREAGLRVPDDVAVAGFDDIPIARFVDPPLTTVGVKIAELGRQAVECCVQILATGEACPSRTVTPELVVRASAPIEHEGRQQSRIEEGEERHESITID